MERASPKKIPSNPAPSAAPAVLVRIYPYRWLVILAVVVFGLDQVSKAWIDSVIPFDTYFGPDRITVIPLSREWTKIGRSLASDVRFDDPTVSRRHALIVRQGGGVRVLDDRSLNGVFLNGERVEWGQLQDDDELVIGRYRLHFLDTTGASAHKGAGASKALA